MRLTDERRDPEPHTDTKFVPRTFSSAREWTMHRERLRRQVLVSTGLWPMPERGPVPVRAFGTVARDGYVVEKLLIETLPGFYVGANLYKPTGAGRNRPGVLLAHGHWKKGRIEHSSTYSVPALGAMLARNGYIALAFDMVGYNDTRQVPHKFGDSEEERNWSYGPLALQLWNSLRMADYLAARPEVDARRLAMTGASGGGTQTYLQAAVDDRIRVSIPAVMVSAKFQGDDPCEMAPGLRVGTNNVEIAAAFAPRPMLLLSTSKDWTSDVPKKEFPAIQAIYALLRRPGSVENLHVDANHGYNAEQRRAALRFLGRHFRMAGEIREPDTFDGEPEEFLVGEKVAAGLPGALDREGVFHAWQRMMTERNRKVTARERVALLREITGGEWPGRVSLSPNGELGVLHREGGRNAVPARVIPGGKGVPMIAVHAKGSAAAAKWKAVEEAGTQVVMIDAFGTGAAEVSTFNRHGDHLVFHRSDDANRVQDILTAAAFLAGQGAKSARLHCGPGAHSWCRLAAEISPMELRVEGETGKEPMLSIPGLLAAGYAAK